MDFASWLPDGRECTSISPQRVQVGTMHSLPGEDALCQTSDSSLVAGWVVPVPQGFTPANVPHGSEAGRLEHVWVPRADFMVARTPSRAPCRPEGHELVGWNTTGDGTGEVIGLGDPLPEDWATHRTNHHTLYAMWRAA